MSKPSDKPARESEFWRFSLNFYGLPNVAPACLVLQDEGSADVNLLLYLLFLAWSKREVTPEHVAKLDAAVALWREATVKPLRALRRALKSGIGDVPPATSENFRNMVKRVELEAERLEQLRLEEAGRGLDFLAAGVREDAARANLAAYGRFLGVTFPAAALATVQSAFEASSH
jgi:uncharacterized protein (TIGR02444 family)